MVALNLTAGNKVKIVVMLRGREMQHNHLAYDLANRFLADLEGEKLTVEKKPSMDGRNVVTILALLQACSKCTTFGTKKWVIKQL